VSTEIKKGIEAVERMSRTVRMDSATIYVRWLAVVGATLGLVACGGGGSGGQTAPPPPPTTYTVGGTVSGLTVDGLVLANNGATVTVNSGAGTFSFGTAVASGTAYAVTVQTTPNGLTCSVANGTGTVGTANVSNVVVTCSDKAYALGGSISGLTSSGLVLSNGMDQLTVPSGATSFTMPASVAFTSSYDVKVSTQPQGLTCSVQNGTATMGAAAVTNIAVTCTDQLFTVGGSISGLTVSGLVLISGRDTGTFPANATSFTFPTAVAYGSHYSVSVLTQPPGLMCTVSSGSGTVPAANVTSVQVTCSSQSYSLGGTVSGLTSSGLVLTDGTDSVSVPANAPGFTMPTPVAFLSHYSVTVATQPAGLGCSVSAGSGTMPAGPVTSVTVTCASTYTLGGTISGLNATGLILTDGTDRVAVAANATIFSMPTGVAYNSPYTVSVASEPTGLTCAITGASGTMPAANVNSVQVACSASKWTWEAGSSTSVNNSTVPASNGFPGLYGTQGTAAAGNFPGSRDSQMTWTDSNGRFWLFGGSGLDGLGATTNELNDMWMYDPATGLWTWVSGDAVVVMTTYQGSYGTQGVAASANVPPARHSATTWVDQAGVLWMFGGANLHDPVNPVAFNDLWSFDPATRQWTWVSGTNHQNDAGTPGTVGVGATTNAPYSRSNATAWIDGTGRLWLFGGLYTTWDAINSVSVPNTFRDLWSFDPATKKWTWVDGSTAMNDLTDHYGTKGVASVSNLPPTRAGASGWIDGTGLLWLFGGGNANGPLGDLWTYNSVSNEWTWFGGPNQNTAVTADLLGSYGTQGASSSSNWPGARVASVVWTDKQGRVWLFGGLGYDAASTAGGTGSLGSLNDLWTFSPSSGQWTWVGGAVAVNASGQYGTQGTGASGNMPGARSVSSGWLDGTGHLWLFGGSGLDNAANSGDLNDLWKF
jgi:N-acetylneuraminic acid mutarotase